MRDLMRTLIFTIQAVNTVDAVFVLVLYVILMINRIIFIELNDAIRGCSALK